MRKLVWLGGLIIGLVGCASKAETVLTNLPLAAEVRGASASITEASLQEGGALERDDHIVVARVSLRNRTGKAVSFGPGHVYVADATGQLFLRISEEWLRDFYTAKVNSRPTVGLPEAIVPFPSDEVTVGDSVFRSPPLTSVQKEKMAEEVAELMDEVFVRPRREAPGTFVDKDMEGALGVLLKDVTLQPNQWISGFVYFYHSAATQPQYPLRLIADLEGEISTFLFH